VAWSRRRRSDLPPSLSPEPLSRRSNGRDRPQGYTHGYGTAVFSRTQGDVSTPRRPFSRWHISLSPKLGTRIAMSRIRNSGCGNGCIPLGGKSSCAHSTRSERQETRCDS